jgi:hypothetical protein
MLTVILILIMIVIGVGLTALYREVGLGRDKEESSSSSPSSPSKWPFGNLATGNEIPGFSDDSFTGFVAFCTDQVDSLGELYSVAVVAEEWDYPLQIAIGKSPKPTGWAHRLDAMPGNTSQQEINIERIGALKPAQLPALVFLNEGRVLDASVALESPTAIAGAFQRCRFGLARGAGR